MDAPDGIDVPWWWLLRTTGGDVRGRVSTIGLDLANHVFQVHRSACGALLFGERLRREQVLSFLAGLPRCRVAMEACASGHYGLGRSASSATRYG